MNINENLTVSCEGNGNIKLIRHHRDALQVLSRDEAVALIDFIARSLEKNNGEVTVTDESRWTVISFRNDL